jgi:hypothetical protein
MNAITKLNVNDFAWSIVDGKAKEMQIKKIEVEFTGDKTEIQYFMNKGTDENYQCFLTHENYVFETRQDLIESL